MNEAIQIDITFRKLLIDTIEKIAASKKLKYSIDSYTSVSTNSTETMDLTDIDLDNIRITLADDFALVVISGVQYEFESWRYKEIETLVNDFTELLVKNL